MHIIKTSPFQRDIIQYISESFLLMIRYLFKKGLTRENTRLDKTQKKVYNGIVKFETCEKNFFILCVGNLRKKGD